MVLHKFSMEASRLKKRRVDPLDNVHQLVGDLSHSFFDASRENLGTVWSARHPTLNALRNIVSVSPSTAQTFSNYATSPDYDAHPLRKTLAAFLLLDSAVPGSLREKESIGQFSINLFKLIEHNSQRDVPNDAAFVLLLDAGKLRLDVDQATRDTYAFRHETLRGLLPAVVSRCTPDDPVSAVLCSQHTLQIPNCPDEMASEMTEVALAAAEKMAGSTQMLDSTAYDNYETVTKTMARMADRFCDGGAKQGRFLKAWEGLAEQLYFVDPAKGVVLPRIVARVPQAFPQPLVEVARQFLDTHRIPVKPETKGTGITMAHLGFTIAEPTFH